MRFCGTWGSILFICSESRKEKTSLQGLPCWKPEKTLDTNYLERQSVSWVGRSLTCVVSTKGPWSCAKRKTMVLRAGLSTLRRTRGSCWRRRNLVEFLGDTKSLGKWWLDTLLLRIEHKWWSGELRVMGKNIKSPFRKPLWAEVGMTAKMFSSVFFLLGLGLWPWFCFHNLK